MRFVVQSAAAFMAAAFIPSVVVAYEAPLATPLGVTVEQSGRSGQVYADARGLTLYTFDMDKDGTSVCYDECAGAWPPLAAPANASDFGDWSAVIREDGSRQWALRGKPLYTFVKDEKPGEKKGDGMADLWRVATFAPVEGLLLPPDVGVREVPSAPGQVLVNAEGMSLYTVADAGSSCTGACLDNWTPLAAPTIASPLGDFAPVDRGDGIYQWAFHGLPLYTYREDVIPGDLNGENTDERFDVAMAVRYFTPDAVNILHRPVDPIHPAILTDASGMTLYAREKWAYTQTFHARDGDRHGANYGRAVGLAGCEAECLESWKPLLASADAQPSGEWSLYIREDGSKQWAYRGFAMYSFTGDERPGDIYADEMFEPWRGENAKVGMEAMSITGTASTMYWRVASP